MSDGFWNAFFSNFAAIVMALGTAVTGIVTVLINRKVNDVKRNTNGMTERLVAEAEKKGYRKGHDHAVQTIAQASSGPVTVPAPLRDE